MKLSLSMKHASKLNSKDTIAWYHDNKISWAPFDTVAKKIRENQQLESAQGWYYIIKELPLGRIAGMAAVK